MRTFKKILWWLITIEIPAIFVTLAVWVFGDGKFHWQMLVYLPLMALGVLILGFVWMIVGFEIGQLKNNRDENIKKHF